MKFYTQKEIGELLRYHPKTLRKLKDVLGLNPIVKGKTILYSEDDLEKLKKARDNIKPGNPQFVKKIQESK